MTQFVSNMRRTFWIVRDLEKYRSNEAHDPYPSGMEVCERANQAESNTISSLLDTDTLDMHAPCLDIDWPTIIWLDGDQSIIEVKYDWPKIGHGTDEGPRPRPVEHIDSSVRALKKPPFRSIISTVFKSGTVFEKLVLQIGFRPEIPVALIPSKSTAHFHCYIDVKLSWSEYERLLFHLNRLGVIQDGFYAMSTLRKMSHLRKPVENLFRQAI